MNDFDPTLDELVSAYLDGETTVDESARVEASAELMSRVDQLRSARDAVATPVSAPPEGHLEQTIAAALAASATADNVTSLAVRQARSARVMRLASVAAVVALIMLAVPLILLARDSDSDSETVASADSAAEESDASFEAAAEEPTDQSAQEPAADPAEELTLEAEVLADDAGGEAAEESADAPTEAPAAEEAAAEPETLDLDALLRVQIDPQLDFRRVAEALFARIGSSDGTGPVEVAPDLHPCTAAFLENLEETPLGFTETVIAGVEIGAVAFESGASSGVVLVSIFELDSPLCPRVSVIVL